MECNNAPLAEPETSPLRCSHQHSQQQQQDEVLIYQAKFRIEDSLGDLARSSSMKMEAAGHKSMRALRQSIRRHESRARQRRSSVALRPEPPPPQLPHPYHHHQQQQQASPQSIHPPGSPEPSQPPKSPPPPAPPPVMGVRRFGQRCGDLANRQIERITWAACTRRNPLPADATCWQRFRFALMCPPHGHVARWVAGILSVLVLYGLLFVIVGDAALPQRCDPIAGSLAAAAGTAIVGGRRNRSKAEESATAAATTAPAATTAATDAPNRDANSTTGPLQTENCQGGNFFGLFVLFVCSMTASSLSKKLNLPPLLGMLVVGCLLGNVPGINVARHISKEYFNKLRELALCTILLRAGLSLDPNTLRRLSATVFRLAFIPCLVESAVGATAAYLILGFPWAWGFILGFVLGAVSPAVVVLGMLKLEYRGYGVEKGIPTLIIAASSMDDVLAITGFSLALGIASNDGERGIAGAIMRGPRDAVIGVAYGVGLGILLWFIPHRGHKRPVMFRFIFLVGGGVIALLGCERAHVQGAGALGVLTLAFVAGYGWRRWDGWAEEANPMLAPLDTMWWFMQPLLFGLIGGQIVFEKIQPHALAKGLAVVGIGLVSRMLASFLCMMGTDLNFKERLFVPFSWLPKATVQAAIGPVALDMALAKVPRDPAAVDMARQILTIAAIVIMLTAPLGAFLISLLGPQLLERDKNWELHHFDLSGGSGGGGGGGHNCHGVSLHHQGGRLRSQADLEAMRKAVVAAEPVESTVEAVGTGAALTIGGFGGEEDPEEDDEDFRSGRGDFPRGSGGGAPNGSACLTTLCTNTDTCELQQHPSEATVASSANSSIAASESAAASAHSGAEAASPCMAMIKAQVSATPGAASSIAHQRRTSF